jgi:hypothetical protein
VNKETDKQLFEQTNKPLNKETDKQLFEQTNKQVNKQTNKQTNKQLFEFCPEFSLKAKNLILILRSFPHFLFLSGKSQL